MTLPQQLALDPRAPEFLQDPYPEYARLRAEAPVYRAPNGDVWLTRYADVQVVLTDHRFGRSAPAYAARSTALDGGSVPPSMLFQNPPDHTRLRALVTRAFTPGTVERLRPRIAAMAEELLERAGDAFDLVEAYAFPFPAMVIAELLGVPRADQVHFHRWTSDVARAVDSTADEGTRARGANAREQMADYFATLVAERSRRPQEDLITQLVQVHQSGDRLSLGELLSMCALLLAAGHETTVSLIANGVLTLAECPMQWTRLRGQSTRIPPTVEELLRYESPVQLTDRVALEDVALGENRIRAGQRVIAAIGAANRDPDVFNDPNRFDPGREPNPHLAFGHGIHFCLGTALARMEGHLALSALLSRFSAIERSGPVVRGTSPMFRAIVHLGVQCKI
jgi:pimeloyl-[acyl-carrier protein] synthase